MLSIYVCTHQEEKTYLSVLYIFRLARIIWEFTLNNVLFLSIKQLNKKCKYNKK